MAFNLLWFANEEVLIAAGCFVATLVVIGGFRSGVRAINLLVGAFSMCVNAFLVFYFVRHAPDPMSDGRVVTPSIALLATMAGVASSFWGRET